MIGFSERLNLAMRTSGESKVSLARKIGIGAAIVDRWLDGTVSPSPIDLRRAASTLEVSPLWLIEGTGEMQPRLFPQDDTQHLHMSTQEKRILCAFQKLNSDRQQLAVETLELWASSLGL